MGLHSPDSPGEMTPSTQRERALTQVGAIAAERGSDRAHRLAAVLETTKPGITKLVTITSLVGFVLGVLGQGRPVFELALSAVACVLGTALAAGGANAMNHWLEREADARMARTAGRPLPTRRLEPPTVFWYSIAMCLAGCAELLFGAGAAAAAVAAVCVVSYVVWYTPLKTLTPWATVVGAIPGALPPLIGWSAARPELGFAALAQAGGLSLFALMFVWQLPHFFAIAWVHRDDYAKGGYRLLPVLDPSGRVTAAVILGTSLVLAPLTLGPALAMPDLLGWIYVVIAVLTGAMFLWTAVRVAVSRSRDDARRVFFASIIHLPLLMVVMVGEAFVRSIWG